MTLRKTGGEEPGPGEKWREKRRAWEVEPEVKKVLLVRRNGTAAFSGPIG
jgi:hypothetical protein